MTIEEDIAPRPKRVLLLGATGTMGRASAWELTRRGHDVTALVRGGSRAVDLPPTMKVPLGDVTDPKAWTQTLSLGRPYDAIISCLASRTGAPRDAWRIDYQAHSDLLAAAVKAGVQKFVLLSAICVQRPKLEFQKAKRAFEEELIASGLDYSIVRPTAFFKSLSGQIDRVKAGKPFLIFGDGRLTSCKPISDRDLACYLANCLDQDELSRKILPVGGPGPAMTPCEQGALLFAEAGLPPKFQSIAPGLFRGAAAFLDALGVVIPPLKQKAAFARIAHYYATESMLVWDEDIGAYSADATPSFGKDRLADHYAAVLAGEDHVALGEHALFSSKA